MNPFEPPVAEIRPEIAETSRRKGPVWRFVVLSCLLGACVFVFYFVIPKFEAIFKDFGMPLPRLTIAAVALSHLVIKYIYLVVPGLLLLLWLDSRTMKHTQKDTQSREIDWVWMAIWTLILGSLILVVVAVAIPLFTLITKLSG